MNAKALAMLLVCAASTACASTPPPASPALDPVSRLYHYVRTNQDGSEPEHIWVFRKSKSEVEVVKEVERCTRAAYVTANLDLTRQQPSALVGGKLQRDGTQEPFAYLTYDLAKRELSARVPMAKIDTHVKIEHDPWRIYDFDLADLSSFSASGIPEQKDFTFGVALAWPADNEHPLKYLGQANAKFGAAEEHLSRPAFRFAVSGALRGDLWLDAREGHVLEARFAEPNHSEYKDFRLVLQTVEVNAVQRWQEVRMAHWRDCKEE